MCWDLISNYTPSHVRLPNNCTWCWTCQNALEWSVFSNKSCYLSSLCQTYKYVHIVIQCDTTCCCCQNVHSVCLLGIIGDILSYIIIYLLVVYYVLSFSNALSQLDDWFDWVLTDWCLMGKYDWIGTLKNSWCDIFCILPVGSVFSYHTLKYLTLYEYWLAFLSTSINHPFLSQH
jgi:hypothetical protein